MRVLVFLIVLSSLLAGCERNSGMQRQGNSNEGKAAQSAAGGSSNEGKAISSAGR
jgi:hypothetical protein